MKMNNTISMALMALLTLGAGTTMAASSDTNEMMKTDGMEKMDGMKADGMEKMDGMKKDGMEEMDSMKKEGMEKMDEMKTDGMSKMDGEMKKDHKKEAAMGS